VDDVDLALALEFVAQRATDNFGIELDDVGLDRQAILSAASR
jgi:hypothetical protein